MTPADLIAILRAASPEQLVEIRRLLFDIPDDRQGGGVTVAYPFNPSGPNWAVQPQQPPEPSPWPTSWTWGIGYFGGGHQQ